MKTKLPCICVKLLIALFLTLAQINIEVRTQAQGSIDLRQKARLVTTDIQEISAGWGEVSGLLYYVSSTEHQTIDASSLMPVTPPPTRILSQEALSHFGIDVSDSEHPKAHYSVSPDGRYVIYSVVVDPNADTYMDNPYCIERHLKLGYVPEGTSTDLGFKTQLALSFEWFGQSSGVGISDGYYGRGCAVYGEPGLIAYITEFTSNLSATRTVPLGGSETEYFHTIYQSSINGRFLLVAGYHFRETTEEPILKLFDTQAMENSNVLAQGRDIAPIVAWFNPNEPDKVTAINHHGLVEIDIHTQNMMVLDPILSGGQEYSFPYRFPSPTGEFYVHEAWGSPDGRWLAYSHYNPTTDLFELYVVDLLEAFAPTPTPMPTVIAPPHGGEPVCPDGSGGVWTWIDGILVFVCGTLVE
ncbi:MAG: hypothetical protein IT322_21200 [Anaerolineae bacterium]|nr:hypothetical protein [Anaerolineae bacterium]